MSVTTFPFPDQRWIYFEASIVVLRVLASEKAIPRLEEPVDTLLSSSRNLEGLNLVLVHEEADVLFVVLVVDVSLPDVERSQLTAVLKLS